MKKKQLQQHSNQTYTLVLMRQIKLCLSQFQLRPSPPGQLRGICVPCQSRGSLANLARPGGRAFAYPRAFDMHMWFPTRNPNMEDFIAKDQQFVADWIVCQGLDKLVEVFSILCICSLLIKAQLSLNIARSGTINVNRRRILFKDLNKI